MNTIYNDAGEQEIRTVVLYANASKLYVDAAHKVEVAFDVALELCQKGMLQVFDTDTTYIPASFNVADNTLTVGYGASKTATVTKK